MFHGTVGSIAILIQLSAKFSVLFLIDEVDISHSDVQQEGPEEVPNAESLEIQKHTYVDAADISESGLRVESRDEESSLHDSTFDGKIDIKSHIVKSEADNVFDMTGKGFPSNKTKVENQLLHSQENASNEVESPESLERQTITCAEFTKEVHDKKYHEEGGNCLSLKQNSQRMQPISNATSQNSSVQTSPLVLRRTSLQAAPELLPQYALLEKDYAPSSERKHKSRVKA